MYACPVCNGLTEGEKNCPTCESAMTNQGRLVDFMGDYIAYLEYDGTNLIDGDPESTQNHTCIHLYYCNQCDQEYNLKIQEVIR